MSALLPKLLKDYENCVEIDEEVANIDTWLNLILAPATWTKLIEKDFRAPPLKTYFKTISREQRENYFAFGVACLVMFVQRNFTGPFLTKEQLKFLDSDVFSKFNFARMLSSAQEEMNPNCAYPQLLIAAEVIFSACHYDDLYNLWWYWRAIMIHLQVIDDISNELHQKGGAVDGALSKMSLDENTRAKLELEASHFYLICRMISTTRIDRKKKVSHVDRAAVPHIEKAKEILGFRLKLLGKLGKRTKYQEDDIAQYAVDVTLLDDIERTPVNDIPVPHNVKLTDDVRLESIKYTDDTNTTVLPLLEQKLLLAIVKEIIVTQPTEEIFFEEVEPCINLLLSQQNTWCVRVATLMHRCKLEASHKRTVERALQQCEEICTGIAKEEPHFLNRVCGVFSTGLQPYWKNSAQYADILLSLGMVERSVEEYEKLQMWDQVIVCYTLLNMKQKAIKVIRKQLEKNPNVKLWCWLGDLTEDTSCYEKAAAMSTKNNPRVLRHWGMHYYTRKEYKLCLQYLEKSVASQRMQPVVWFRIGFAYLQEKEYTKAAHAFQQYVMMEPDSFEGWNNLASAYLRSKRLEHSCAAIKQAIRCGHDKWEVWENFLHISADTAHFPDMLRAYERLIELRGKFLSIGPLMKIVYHMKENEGAANPLFTKEADRVRELLSKVTGDYPSEPHVWELYAEMATAPLLTIQRYQRAFRGHTQEAWANDLDMQRVVLRLCEKMAVQALDTDIPTNKVVLNSVKLNLNAAVQSCKKHGFVETKEMVEKIESLRQLLITRLNSESKGALQTEEVLPL